MSKISLNKELELIRAKLKHFTTESRVRRYLDTGSPELNGVLGRPGYGIPYGKVIELFGENSHGKSGLSFDLLAMAQQDGAYGVLVDAENSYTEEWATKRGVDVGNLAVISPYAGSVGKKPTLKNTRMMSAEELLQEAHELIMSVKGKNKKARFFMIVDSTAALLTEAEATAGLTDQNMNSRSSLPRFMSQLMRRWVGFAGASDTTTVFVNQLRSNIGQMFGNPDTTPGGRALKFYSHVRASVRRVKGGRIMTSGKQIGIKGIIKNYKNKCGGVEGSEIGYQLMFAGYTKIVPVAKIKMEEK